MKTIGEVYVIRDTVTGSLVKFGVKCGWVSSGAAKNAYNLRKRYNGSERFDEQSRYVIEMIQ